MKKHISVDQYNDLTSMQKRAAESYYRCQSEPKEHEYYKFWNLGRMIEFLDDAAWMEITTPTDNITRWTNIYGFNLSGTVQEEWCDKLWERVVSRFQEDIEKHPLSFRN